MGSRQEAVCGRQSARVTRHASRGSGLLLAALLAWPAPARADAAADLRQADQALAQRDLAAASTAYRSVFEAAPSTPEQRKRAFDGLLDSAVAAGRPADLLAYLDKRLGEAPDTQRPLVLAASFLCQKAIDGSFRRAIARLQAIEDKRDIPYTRQLVLSAQNACIGADREAERALAQFRRESLAAERLGKADRVARRRTSRTPEVPAPPPLSYAGGLERLSPPPPARLRGQLPRLRIAEPQAPRQFQVRPDRVTAPAAAPRHAGNLAPRFFAHFYQRASELADNGNIEGAKDEYGALMQLFPGSPQAQQAARYAIHLFEREHGVNQGAQALVAYLKWVRSMLGEKDSDYAEYLAFRHFSTRGNPAVLVREAEAFIARHPDSKWGTGIRLQLALALDNLGNTSRAIEVLKPIASPLDEAQRITAAWTLAWLYLFQGEAAGANALLQGIASQDVSAQDAERARRLLAEMKDKPLLSGVAFPSTGAVEPADEVFADKLLRVGDQALRDGDAERAMDLYTLYLRAGSGTPGFWAARSRIERLKQSGRAEEE